MKVHGVTVVSEDIRGGAFNRAGDVHFERVVVEEVDFARWRPSGFTSAGATFAGCRFDGFAPRSGTLGLPPRCVFRDCSFDAADLRAVEPGHVRFERCAFVGARIENWFAYCAEFVDCVLAAEISGCVFSGRPHGCGELPFSRLRRRGLEFRGNDFRRATISDTRFGKGIDLDAQQLPSGDSYLRIDDALPAIDAARARVRSTEPVLLRELETLRIEAEEQGGRLFLNRLDYANLPEEIQEALWDLLLRR